MMSESNMNHPFTSRRPNAYLTKRGRDRSSSNEARHCQEKVGQTSKKRQLFIEVSDDELLPVSVHTKSSSSSFGLQGKIPDPNNCDGYSQAEEVSLYDICEESSEGFSFACKKYNRRAMEDRVSVKTIRDNSALYFGLFDGHNSKWIPQFLADNLHLTLEHEDKPDSSISNVDHNQVISSFLRVDKIITEKQIKSNTHGGSTALVTLLTAEGLTTANLGDSRAVLYDKKTGNTTVLTRDHNCHNQTEKDRIIDNGGWIIETKNSIRLQGEIEVTRSFGDRKYKPFLIATPEICHVPLSDLRGKYLIMATDGLWKYINSSQLPKLPGGEQLTSGKILEYLEAQQSFIGDNVSVIVGDLDQLLQKY